MNLKTKELDSLFDEWENSIKGYKGIFKRDGIVDETLFNNLSPKVLFITKEPNDPIQTSGDYREWWQEGVKYSFSHRIAEWSYGILNDFPEYDVLRKNPTYLHDAIKKISFLNIKKIGGNGSSNKEEILKHLNLNSKFIHSEISIISPDIIITGISWNSVREKLFPNVKWIESGYRIAIGKYNNIKLIDFYHPSSRTAPAASYSLLQNVLNSSAFQHLI